MSKVITFSRVFPKYHPKAGQPTYFVEKILAGLADSQPLWKMPNHFTEYDWHMYYNCAEAKVHTIRNGNRWKVGDKFSPRIWSDKPYKSKQIIFSTDIQIKKVFSFSKDLISEHFYLNGIETHPDDLMEIAKNDGLELSDLLLWFQYPKPFNGQIICWSEDVSYLNNLNKAI